MGRRAKTEETCSSSSRRGRTGRESKEMRNDKKVKECTIRSFLFGDEEKKRKYLRRVVKLFWCGSIRRDNMCNHHIFVVLVVRASIVFFSLFSFNKIFLLLGLFRVRTICKWVRAASTSFSLYFFFFVFRFLVWHIPSTDWKSSPTHLHDFTWTHHHSNTECIDSTTPAVTTGSCWLPEYDYYYYYYYYYM